MLTRTQETYFSSPVCAPLKGNSIVLSWPLVRLAGAPVTVRPRFVLSRRVNFISLLKSTEFMVPTVVPLAFEMGAA